MSKEIDKEKDKLRRKISDLSKQQDIFLLLDEVPCNSNKEDSGDWSGLERNEVHLMMALKPIGEHSIAMDAKSSKQIKLHFLYNIEHLKLNRVYKCTQTILNFYKRVVKRLNANPFVTKFNSWSANL